MVSTGTQPPRPRPRPLPSIDQTIKKNYDNLYSAPSGRKKEEKNNNNLTKLNYYKVQSVHAINKMRSYKIHYHTGDS